jgi:hypothetical protein
MYGEGYDWAQQYSVSSGDFVGSLPVGMQSRGNTDLPYWPSQNMYVYKEVWVHSSSRWLWLMADLLGDVPRADSTGGTLHVRATQTAASDGRVTIRVTATGEGTHTLVLRSDNLRVQNPARTVTLRPGTPVTVEFLGRRQVSDLPWLAVVIPDREVNRRHDVVDGGAR